MSERAREIRSYAIGLVSALVLTTGAFASVHWQFLTAGKTWLLICGLGLAQMIVHFRYFLHVDLQQKSRDTLQLIMFAVLIIALMVGGTLVVLFNLQPRMM